MSHKQNRKKLWTSKRYSRYRTRPYDKHRKWKQAIMATPITSALDNRPIYLSTKITFTYQCETAYRYPDRTSPDTLHTLPALLYYMIKMCSLITGIHTPRQAISGPLLIFAPNFFATPNEAGPKSYTA